MELEMRTCNCAACGMSFAIPEAYARRKIEDHTIFYCPNGHNNYYPQKTEAEKLREKLAGQEKRLADIEAEKNKLILENKRLKKSVGKTRK